MTSLEELEQAIAALERQRAVLGDAVVETALAPLRKQLAEVEDAKPKQQRKLVTILFADVSGFTAMSETMDAEDVTNVMNALWERLDGAIIQQGGHIDKHIGDAVMALWGTPVANEDDPEQAIRAGLAMQAELTSFREERGVGLAMRIGINTGPVLLGEVGTTGEFTAIGDAVNLASRLEHAAPVGDILISHNTYRHVRGLFDANALGPIKVKGKVEPIRVYVIKSAKPRAFRVPTRGVQGVETRMIGREGELQKMQEGYHTSVNDRLTQVVTVVGDAGLGKSRLLYEFNNWLELEQSTERVFRGRATLETRQTPYALIRELFASGFQIHDSDSAESARGKIEQGILSFLEDDPGGIEKAHFIGHLIGFDFSHSPYLRGIIADARQIRDRAFRYLNQFFQAAAHINPVVIFLEDIHWADDGSLDLIEHVANAQPGLRLLIITLTRASLFEHRPTWGEGWTSHTRLDLETLSREDSRRLLEEILQKVPEIPQALEELVLSGGEGNPFYIEELVKVLIDDGVILRGEERWEVIPEKLVEVRVPPTLTGVIQARLDRLNPDEKSTMQRAAVVGRVFWDGVIAQFNAHDREAVQEILGRLREKELVFHQEDSSFQGEREHIFKHALLHEITYESVLKGERRSYHKLVGDWLIQRSGEQVRRYAGRIAEHYELAEKPSLAAQWYGRAGKGAKDAYASQSAIEYFRKALALTPEESDFIPEMIKYHEQLGELLDWQNRIDEAEAAVHSMKELADAYGDAQFQARALVRMSVLQERRGNYREALKRSQEAVSIAESAGLDEDLVKGLLYQGKYAHMLGEIDTAGIAAKRSLSISQELGDRGVNERAVSLSLLSFINSARGDFEQAQEEQEEVIQLRRTMGDRRGEMHALMNLGNLAHRLGKHETSLSNYEKAYSISQQIDDENAQIEILSDIGSLQVELNRYEQAEEHLREAIQACERIGDKFSQAYASLFLAQALLGQDKVGVAFSVAQRTLVMMLSMEWQERLGEAWQVVGRCLAHTQSPDHITLGERTFDTSECYQESVRVYEDMGAHYRSAQVLREWANFEMQQGDPARAERLLERAETALAQAEVETAGRVNNHGH